MLHPTAARRLIDRCHATSQPKTTAAQALLERLTPRERDVLGLLAQGETNADIAVSRIIAALDVANRVRAALLARDAGQVTFPERRVPCHLRGHPVLYGATVSCRAPAWPRT